MKTTWFNRFRRKRFKLICCIVMMPFVPYAQQLLINESGGAIYASVVHAGKTLLQSPAEGLWSVSTAWEDNGPANWRHAKALEVKAVGEWKVLSGKLVLPEGEWLFTDSYKEETGRIKCIRRFEWKGKQTLNGVTLSVRWIVPSSNAKPFLPGILYYGNPSGEKNGPNSVAWYHGQAGDEALFEEHRYPMPFACMEWSDNNRHFASVLHTVPSPVPEGHHKDQWWSLGVKTAEASSELRLLSGPVGFNGQKSVAKALQEKPMPYGDTYMQVKPGAVIEKTFYLEAYPVTQRGSGFQQAVYTSLDLFQPFYTGDLPSYHEIIKLKYRFAASRWMEGDGYAGYNMYPAHVRPRIVAGWAGQSEAPGYALQVLAGELNDASVWSKVQKLLDHFCQSPIGKDGFCVEYDVGKNQWRGKDPVSQGQALNNMADAILQGRKNKKVNTAAWETFFKKAIDVFAERILAPGWKPHNTAEAFFIKPLLAASLLFKNTGYKNAALKAVDHYAARHLSMDEPYWGGTLDATCEDKEGAWGAFQGFLAAYEFTKDARYLTYAKHACDVTISYAVVWDIPLPAGRMADHALKTRGWTVVSAQNQHLDVYGVLFAPSVFKMGVYLKNEPLKKLAKTLFLSCGQMIDPTGSQGEQLQHTNFAQHGDMSNVFGLRGGYSESWTVFWITAHFLRAAAEFKELGVKF